MSPKSLRTCKGRWLANAAVKVFYGSVGDGLNPVIDGLRHTDRVSTPQGDLSLLDVILSAVVPMFFVMALGYLAGWMRDIDNHQVAELNALVMDFALPASLFVAMVQTPRELPLVAALVAAVGLSAPTGREAIILCAVPSGFFGILFGLRYGIVSQDSGSLLIASTVLSAATLPAAILLTPGTH
jgi:predicted permease